MPSGTDPCVRIGLVDSGVAGAAGPRIANSAAFVLDGDDLVRVAAEPDRLGHGTAVAAILAECMPDAALYVAQVFGARHTTTALQVAAAIDWLVAQDVQVINLSLGLREDRPVLARACARAIDAGVLLCAASPARGAPVWPAAYPGVLRMTGDARCARDEISALDSAQADFGAHVLPLDGARVGAGASIGCAWLTGRVGRLLADGCPARIEAVREALTRSARYHGTEHRQG